MGIADKIKKYRQLLINLLPPGKLWKPLEQPTFYNYLTAVATELCRVDDRLADLLFEADPRQTLELLDDWQRLLGLPDSCTFSDLNIDEIRTQILQKLTNVGGLSKTYYEFLGSQLGYDIEVNNKVNFVAGRGKAGDPLTNYYYKHFVAGSKAGEVLTEVGWLYYFEVNMPIEAAEHFVAGSLAGDALRTFSNPLIECTMRKLKPAHSAVFFSFRE